MTPLTEVAQHLTGSHLWAVRMCSPQADPPRVVIDGVYLALHAVAGNLGQAA